VNRLTDMTFDEVSAVDVPANQLGRIAIAKSAAQEEQVSDKIFDGQGEEVDPDTLEAGDVVYTADGTELTAVPVDEDGNEVEDDADEVGKSMFSNAMEGAKRGAGLVGRAPGGIDTGSRAYRAGNFVGRKPRKTAAAVGGAAGVAGGGAYALRETSKSLGDEVLTALAKAATDTDRNAVIAKAMDEVSKANARAAQAQAEIAKMRDEQATAAFVAKAAELGIPADPEVAGPILKAAYSALNPQQQAFMDQVLAAGGDAIFTELGKSGAGNGGSMFEEVVAHASDLVEKASGGITHEQAVAALFEANPAAYDEYLRENGR
jgi:hypothetical protein